MFDEDTLRATIAALRSASRSNDITVERRAVADIDALCLVTTPTASDLPAETLCLSEDGAIVVLEQGEERTAATSYTSDVPGDRFDLPAN